MKKFSDFLKEDINESHARLMVIFERGKLTNFKQSVAPHLADKYTADEFAETIFEHFSDGDLDDALGHLFSDVDFEIGGTSPKIIFLRCIKKDINIIIHY